MEGSRDHIAHRARVVDLLPSGLPKISLFLGRNIRIRDMQPYSRTSDSREGSTTHNKIVVGNPLGTNHMPEMYNLAFSILKWLYVALYFSEPGHSSRCESEGKPLAGVRSRLCSPG